MTITREDLIDGLLGIPTEIADLESALLETARRLEKAERRLEMRRAQYLIDGSIDGKNEAIREAQLFELTADEREAAIDAREERDAARVMLHLAENRFAGLRAISRLLAGDDRAAA